VAPSRRLRRRQAEVERVDATDCVGPCYDCFVVFLLLGPRGIVVILSFCLSLYIGPQRVGALCHFLISFIVSRLEVSQEHIFRFQSNEGGSVVTSVDPV
jgi:hypothetical protein